MDLFQLRRGMDYYTCKIQKTWVRDPIRVINHPTSTAALVIIGREALRAHLGRSTVCPLSARTDIDWFKMAVLCSAREMILFALTALHHIKLGLILITDTAEKQAVYDTLQNFIKNFPSQLLAQMENLLALLAQNLRLPHSLYLHQMELDNLASFGVHMQVPLQKCYLFEHYQALGKDPARLVSPAFVMAPTALLELPSVSACKRKATQALDDSSCKRPGGRECRGQASKKATILADPPNNLLTKDKQNLHETACPPASVALGPLAARQKAQSP